MTQLDFAEKKQRRATIIRFAHLIADALDRNDDEAWEEWEDKYPNWTQETPDLENLTGCIKLCTKYMDATAAGAHNEAVMFGTLAFIMWNLTRLKEQNDTEQSGEG